MLEEQILKHLAEQANSNAGAVSEPWLKEHWREIGIAYHELGQIRSEKNPGRQPEGFRPRPKQIETDGRGRT